MYGMRLSRMFEIPGISSERPITLIENLGFRSKKTVFQIKKFEILGLSHIKSKILSILSKKLDISKTWNLDLKAGTEMVIMFCGYFCFLQMFGL